MGAFLPRRYFAGVRRKDRSRPTVTLVAFRVLCNRAHLERGVGQGRLPERSIEYSQRRTPIWGSPVESRKLDSTRVPAYLISARQLLVQSLSTIRIRTSDFPAGQKTKILAAAKIWRKGTWVSETILVAQIQKVRNNARWCHGGTPSNIILYGCQLLKRTGNNSDA